MEALKKRHAEHDAEVRRLSKEIQRRKRRARGQGQCGPMKLRESQRSIARVLVCMKNGEPTAAVQYVARSQRTRCCDAASKEQLEADLRDWWRATDVEERQTYLVVDETNAKMRKAIVQAKRFAVDGTLEAWVDIQNVQKGINPAPAIVMQQAVAVKRRFGLEHPACRRSSRRWLQRWRHRCGIQLRRGLVQEQLSVHQMHGKVMHGAAPKSSWGVGWLWVGRAPG